MLNNKAREAYETHAHIQSCIEDFIAEIQKLCGTDELALIDISIYNWPYLRNTEYTSNSVIDYHISTKYVEYFFTYKSPYCDEEALFSFKVYNRWMDMEPSDILKDIINLSKDKRGKDRQRKLEMFFNLAKELGFSCTRIGD